MSNNQPAAMRTGVRLLVLTVVIASSPMGPPVSLRALPGAGMKEYSITSVAGLSIVGGSGEDLRFISSGDVNGDGLDDLLLGARFSSGPNASRPNGGSAYIIFGRKDLPREKLFDTRGQLGVSPDVTLYGAEPWDTFGNEIAEGDVNGDGIDDLLIEASMADGPANARPSSGEVYVILGGQHLTRGTIRDMAGRYGKGPDAVLYGADAGDHLGYWLDAADVNGDGIDDIVTSAFEADGPRGTRADAGTVYVVFGHSDFNAPVVRDMGGRVGRGPDVTLYGARPGDHLGFDLEVGDINGDGLQDLILGSRHHDGLHQNRADAGAAFIMLGRDDLASGTILDAAGEVSRGMDLVIYGGANNDLFGSAVAAGDVDGDGIDDIVVGAIAASQPAGTRRNAGAVYVFYGSQNAGSGVRRDVAGSEGAGPDLTVYGGRSYDFFGRGLAVADVNGDQRQDLIMGAMNAIANVFTGSNGVRNGQIVILFGGDSLRSSLKFDVAGELGPTADVLIQGARPNDELGFALYPGDLNGDGIQDVCVTAHGSTGPQGNRPGAGMAYIIWGRQRW